MFFRRNSEARLDRGLADPGPIATLFWQDDEGLSEELYLDAIVTVADANFLDKVRCLVSFPSAGILTDGW